MHTSYSESDEILEDQLFSMIFILLNTTTTGNNSNSGIFISQDRYRSVSLTFYNYSRNVICWLVGAENEKMGSRKNSWGTIFFHPLNISGEHKEPPICFPMDQVTISIHPAPSNLQLLSNSLQHNYSLSIGLYIKRKLPKCWYCDYFQLFKTWSYQFRMEVCHADGMAHSTFWKTSVFTHVKSLKQNPS